MKLIDCINTLYELDEEATIYAQEPWTKDSIAVVAVEPEDVNLPPEAVALGLSYFLEVAIAREFLEGWEKYLTKPATNIRRCNRIIQYAINDA